MSAFTTPKRFHYENQSTKFFINILHTTQMTQAISLLKAKTKTIFYIGCDHLTLSMAIVLSIHALQFGNGCEHSKAMTAI
jgi:hypothetical protein